MFRPLKDYMQPRPAPWSVTTRWKTACLTHVPFDCLDTKEINHCSIRSIWAALFCGSKHQGVKQSADHGVGSAKGLLWHNGSAVTCVSFTEPLGLAS
jgi:hypothetical protein